MKYLIFILSILILSGCDLLKSHSRWAMENQGELCATLCSQPIDTSTSISYSDTIYEKEIIEMYGVDSLMLSLFFDCDSNRQIYLRNSESLQSKNGKLLYELKKGQLTIKALYDSLEVKSKIIYSEKTKNIVTTIAVPVFVEKKVVEIKTPWWVWFSYGVGTIAFVWLGFKKFK